jgi:nitrogen fixation protein FixH
MSPQQATATAPAKPGFILTGWHVLAIFVVTFGIVIGVNVFMVMRAYATFPGQVVDKPYEEGLGFNAAIHRRAAAKALGWKATLDNDRTGAKAHLVLAIKDRDGQPVPGLTPTGQLTRTVTLEGAQAVRFHQTSPGVYEADVAAAKGLWDFTANAAAPGGQVFEVEQRLVWK